MNHATTCKFCKKPIVLEIDDDYSKLGDPADLLGLAACNRCADLRVKRRELEERLARICVPMTQIKGDGLEVYKTKNKENLIRLTKGYARMIGQWLNAAGSFWDIECVNVILDHPEAWSKSLAMLWKMYQ